MSIHPGQLRSLIEETLRALEPEVPYSEPAVELLMMTAAAESALGRYIKQIGGPARGIFQICLLYTSPSPRDRQKSRMPSSA
jgi:hypothetical protein